MSFVTKLNEVNFEGHFFIYCKMASIQRTEALSRKSTFYSCSCINTRSKSLINRTVQACLQDSGAAGRLISCQPTQMTSAEVTQHESCVDGDTWFLSLWVIGIIFHLSAQHYLNWWRPCVVWMHHLPVQKDSPVLCTFTYVVCYSVLFGFCN